MLSAENEAQRLNFCLDMVIPVRLPLASVSAEIACQLTRVVDVVECG